MKTILVRRFGPPEVLEMTEVADPAPGRGQLVVTVKAAGVNPVETYTRAGRYAVLPELPYTPGSQPGRELVAQQGAHHEVIETSACGKIVLIP